VLARLEELEGAWYDVRSVGRLSLVEAGVIADRVLLEFEERHPLATDEAGRLRVALVSALHACFVTNSLGASRSTGGFRDECVRVTVAAAAPIIGALLANDLGRSLGADMRQFHRAEPS